MGWQLWVIIGLVVLGWYQYTYPGQEVPVIGSFISTAFDWVNGFIGQGSTETETDENPCPDTYDPVCGNGVTYDNICEAALADVLDTTAGECS